MGAIKDAYDIIKELVKSTKTMVDSVQASDFCAKLLEVQSMIMDAREENEELKENIRVLKQEIENLQQDNLPNDLRWSNGGVGVYEKDGTNYHICRHCHDKTKKVIHLAWRGNNAYYCKACDCVYFLYSDK